MKKGKMVFERTICQVIQDVCLEMWIRARGDDGWRHGTACADYNPRGRFPWYGAKNCRTCGGYKL